MGTDACCPPSRRVLFQTCSTLHHTDSVMRAASTVYTRILSSCALQDKAHDPLLLSIYASGVWCLLHARSC
jgi:hypothetical protein